MELRNKKGEVISHEEYQRLHEDKSYKFIGRSKVGKYLISTVWVGMVFIYESEEPLLFETMVFEIKDGEVDFNDLYVRKYATEKEAETGHDEVVKIIRSRPEEILKD
jgi:hypothetical protein